MTKSDRLYVVGRNGDVAVCPNPKYQDLSNEENFRESSDNQVLEFKSEKIIKKGFSRMFFKISKDQKIQKKLNAEQRLGSLCQGI